MAPVSPAFIEILEIVFPQEEAEVAVKLPSANSTLQQLQKLFPEKADGLEGILGRMVQRGTVFTTQSPGKERVYRLLPTVVGFAETPFWAGKDTPMAGALLLCGAGTAMRPSAKNWSVEHGDAHNPH